MVYIDLIFILSLKSMASTGERSAHDGSRPRRLWTLSVPLPPTSQAIPPPPTSQGLPPAPTSQQLPLPLTLQQIAPSSSPQGSSAASASSVAGPSARSWGRGTGRRRPTRGVTEKRCLDGQQWNVSLVRGYSVGPTSDHFTSRIGVVSKVYCKIWQKDFAKLPLATQELIFRDLQLTYQWERTAQTDREMLAHMSAMHRSWRSKQKKRHFNGKPLDDAIASVPAGVDLSDWQTMCELWTTGDERSQIHGRTPHRLEVFKMGRCKDLPDGTESWVDEESRRRYEAMSEMIALSDVHAESQTTATPEDAFISVMGKRSTWSCSLCREWRDVEDMVWIYIFRIVCLFKARKANARTIKSTRRQIESTCSVASKVDEMSILLSQIQASQARTQPVPVPPPIQSESDSEIDEAADDYLDHDVPVS
ncbi:hypothetical protein Taro_009476 [Colocasia esculenta]|uniref:Uncharacterized protein n=1 Tax=Colocasia esculenta TaxID=4460 RepID=A0A843U0Y7_COLES|nr:hypothetical protein [Colocasia esculenta]